MTESATVYELRIYHAVPGKLDELGTRFRDDTDKLFAKHGMKSVCQLDGAGRAGEKQHVLLHFGTSKPRGGGCKLESFSGGC